MKKNQPIHFIKAEKDGKLLVNNQAMNILNDIKTPICVISIAGLARTGKSYILNRIIQKLTKDDQFQGFQVGSSIDSCTRGIWMWSTPIEYQLKGKKVSIIIMDTEGLSSLEEGTTHDAKIFTMSILLSSLFVYNSMGTIDESAIDRLSLVCELTKHISAKTSKNGSREEEEKALSQFSPFFLWVLRDFSLELTHEEKEITCSEYLEYALQIRTENSKNSERNKVRKSIQTLFPERDSFTFVRPVLDEKKLQKMSKISEKDLRPEFIEEMNNFLNLIQNKLKMKEINNTSLNGASFCQITKSYVESMNSGGVPSISNTWNSVVQIQCNKAVEISVKLLESRIEAIKNVESSKLNEIFADIEKSVLEVFNNNAIGEIANEYREKLLGIMKKQFEKKKQEIDKDSEIICQRNILEISKTIHQNISKGVYKSFTDFNIDLNKFTQKYKEETYGPQQLPIFLNFLEKDVMNFIHQLGEKKDQQTNDIIEKLEDEKKKLLEEIQKLKVQLEGMNEKLKEISTLKKEKNLLEENLQKLKEENLKKVNQIEEIHKREETLQKKVSTIEKESNEKYTKKKEEIHQLETKFKQLENENKKVKEEKEKMKQNNEKETLQLKETLEKEKLKMKEKLEKENEKMKRDHDSELSQMKEKLESLNQDHSKDKEKMKTYQEKIKSLENEMKSTKEQITSGNKAEEKLMKQIKEKEKEIDNLNQQHDRKIKQQDDNIKSLEQEIKNLKEKNKEYKEKEKEFENQKKEYEKSSRIQEDKYGNEIQKLKNSKSDLERENKKLNQKFEELKTEQQKQIDDLKNNLKFIEYDKEDLLSQIEILKQEKNDLMSNPKKNKRDEMEEDMSIPQDVTERTPKKPKRKDTKRLSMVGIKSQLKELKIEFDPKSKKSDLEKIYHEALDKIEQSEKVEEEVENGFEF